jgi:NAD(P)-dependent dehydrogenase (short-subunit alcohol dehydrogenase family)
MAEQVAIITGAGGGIGRAIAVELSRLACSTVLVGRTEESLKQTAGLVADSLIIPADVTRPEDVDAIIAKSLARFGRIDALVNNAGSAPVLNIEQTTPQIWREVLETNLSSAFYLTRAAWPTFVRQKSGVIVNISSMAARDPFPGFAAYGAAKAGLANLGLSVANEGALVGVRVYTVAPGAVETPMLRKILSPTQFPSENALKPEEVAAVVGQCVTGQTSHPSGQVIWISK